MTLVRNETKALMPIVYLEIMQLRYEGWKYPSISEKVGYSLGHIKRMMSKGGILYEIYKEYVQEQNEYRTKISNDILKAHVSNVSRRFAMIVTNPRSKDSDAISAGKEILDRVLGKSKETHEVQGTLGIATLDILKAIDDAKNEQQNKDNSKSAN